VKLEGPLGDDLWGFASEIHDIAGAGAGVGSPLFRSYHDLIRLSKGNAAISSHLIEVAVSGNSNRVIAFHRRDDTGEFLVVGNLGNAPYAS
jgi:1,4-alpha-glucan branching enzyme